MKITQPGVARRGLPRENSQKKPLLRRSCINSFGNNTTRKSNAPVIIPRGECDTLPSHRIGLETGFLEVLDFVGEGAAADAHALAVSVRL
jgi:hypothetical protein